MWCHTNCDRLNDDNFPKCKHKDPKHALGYMLFIERQGYCPFANKFTDPEKQEAHEKSKEDPRKKRVGQQKQKRKKQ